MKVLNRKVLRELVVSRGLLLAITSLIAVGVMCFIYMRSACNNLDQAKQEYYQQCRMADFWIDLKKVPLAELDMLAQLPGVSEIRPRIQSYATVDLPNVVEPINALVLSLPDVQQSIINDIVLTRGSYFTEQHRNEVIINDTFARLHGLHPGQWIHLLLNNRREQLFIAGTAISSEFVYLMNPGSLAPDREHFGVFYVKQTYAEEVFDMDGAANQVVGVLDAEWRDRSDEILRRAEYLLNDYGVFSTTARKDQPSNRFLSDEIRGLGVFAQFMPAIFLAVAALVLNMLMVRLIDQQRNVVGTLKALGYSNSQIFWHFLKFGGAVGLCGGVLGLPLGYGMATFVTSVLRNFFEFPHLQNVVYPDLYMTGLAISLGCSLVGSWQGTRGALRLSPAEAMRPKPPVAGGRIWLEQFTHFWQRLSFGWRMVLRNVIRHKARTAVGIFAACMGAAILTTGFMLRFGIEYIIDFQFEKVMHSDVDLGFKDEHGWDALQEVRNLSGVDYAEPTLDVACEFFHGSNRHKGNVTGLVSAGRLLVPHDQAGRIVTIEPVGLTMSRKLADLLQVTRGDTVLMQPIKGLRRTCEVPIANISDSYVGLAVYANIEYLSRLIGEELALTGVEIQTDPRATKLSEMLKEIKELPALQNYSAKADAIHNLVETALKTQMIFIVLLSLFAGIIFFCSLLNTSLIGLAERRREVATLRVVGYTSFQIGGYFLRESMLVNLLGTLLGLPTGYALTLWLTKVRFDTEMFRFPLVTRPAVWLLVIGLAIVFCLAAHFFVQAAINRMDWREALNVKE
ncbi:MAG TPA: FtsX-like permease family protein [Pirellulales bacterium]|nr:FtsX-like permease family protein [Pirellulales bacterium]